MREQNPESGRLFSIGSKLGLNELQDRLTVLTEWNPNPIIELDANLAVTFQNLSAKIKFPDLLELKSAHPILSNLAPVISELWAATSEIIVYEHEVKVNQEIYQIQIFAMPKNNRVYLFMNEVTKRRQVENENRQIQEQLFQSQKMDALGKLTGGIAHDFNNILTVIQGNLQLLKAEPSNDERAKKRIAAALLATERAARLSKRLLAFSRKGDLEPKVIDIPIFMAEVTNLIKPALGKNIQFDIEMLDTPWKIFADPHQLESAIINIVVNARDAMESRGQLRIRVRNEIIEEKSVNDKSIKDKSVLPGKYLNISIADTGSGIPREILSKVFDPFFTTKESGKGTGLGLSMVYGFLVQSQGYITIDSEVGIGTTVNLFFPKIQEIHVTPDVEKKNLEDPSSTPLRGHERILLVEDDDAIRVMCSEHLRNLGYTVIEAGNSIEALSLLEKTPNIDLIFSDVILPGNYNGITLVKEAKKIHPNIKFLLTSGFTGDAIGEEKDIKILKKPYNLTELSSVLRTLLEKNRPS